jgi:hypothetical protein
VSRVGSMGKPPTRATQQTQPTKSAAITPRHEMHRARARRGHSVRTLTEVQQPFEGYERRHAKGTASGSREAECTACCRRQKQRSQWHEAGTDRSIGKHCRWITLDTACTNDKRQQPTETQTTIKQTPRTREPEPTKGTANSAPMAAQSHMARRRDPEATTAVRNNG